MTNELEAVEAIYNTPENSGNSYAQAGIQAAELYANSTDNEQAAPVAEEAMTSEDAAKLMGTIGIDLTGHRIDWLIKNGFDRA